MARWTAIALLLLTAGCARQRVAYEVHHERQPLARRSAPRRAAPSFPASAYAHDDPRHRCDARCETYWPDVYAHGHADHRCDTSCASYQPPRPQPRTVSSYQSPTYASSPLTGGSAGVRVGVTYDRTPAPAPVRVTPAATRYEAYAHGHARHRCDAGCASFAVTYSHGHARHSCQPACGSYAVVYPHGHVRHRCGSSCRVYDDPHGHAHHVCTRLCVPGVALRSSNGRFEVRIGGNRPHGDRLHACNSACSWYTPPSAFYAHGHRLHACGRGCGAWAGYGSVTVRSGRRWVDPCPPVRRPRVRWNDCDPWPSRRWRGGVNVGFGIRLR